MILITNGSYKYRQMRRVIFDDLFCIPFVSRQIDNLLIVSCVSTPPGTSATSEGLERKFLILLFFKHLRNMSWKD